MLTPEQLREDLDYTVRILRQVHPAAYRGFSRKQEALIDSACQNIQNPMTVRNFYFLVNSVMGSFKDGHTQLYPMLNQQNRCIDLSLTWLQEGLYIKESRGPFQQGDRITAIGSRSVQTLLAQLRPMITAENDHYLRLSAEDKLIREEFLDYLSVIENDTVEIHVERDGDSKTFRAPLIPLAQRTPSAAHRSWIGYEIDPDLSLGVFRMDQCIPNEQYTKTLRSFFEEVRDRRIRNIAIDVRQNGGGNSQVIPEFFAYLNIHKYKGFGCQVRFSREIQKITGSRRSAGMARYKPGIGINDRVDDPSLLFDGRLFVLTSPSTFSTGNWFAVIVKDNKLGTVIGEPTGNAPTSFGDSPSFQMPNTGLKFSVSHKKWIRPNPKNDPADALYPDIPIYTTGEDIKKGTDPQIEALRSLVKNTHPSPHPLRTLNPH